MNSVIESSPNVNEPGLYMHPTSGRQIVLHNHPIFGTTDVDAYVHAGWVRIGDAPQGELTSKFAHHVGAQAAEALEAAPVQSVTVDLDEVSRKQLETEATYLGIKDVENKKAFPNKQALADAIAEAKKGQE